MTAETAAAPSGVAAPGPGVYDIPAETYHADTVSLSSSGARKLLPPSCPAKFRHEQDHGQPFKKAFEFGTAAHQMVLGSGPELVVVEGDDWRTKAARAQADAARERGAIPLKTAEYEQITAMADAIRRHPVARHLFATGSGVPEQSLYWVDKDTGITCRARPDWLPNSRDGRMVLPDYKTMTAVDDESIAKHIHNFGYHQQAAWYLDGVRALGLAGRDAVFVLVFQEKTPPFLVRAVQLDLLSLRIADAKNARSRAVFATCMATGMWPGYGDDVAYLSLPPWAQTRESEEYL